MAEKNNHTRRLLFNALGLFFSVIPPAVSIFSYFPIWVAREDASVLSGLSLVLIIAALIPCYKYVKEALRTPTHPINTLPKFLVFMLLSSIAHEITVISFVGFVSNTVGAVFFKIARGMKNDRRA